MLVSRLALWAGVKRKVTRVRDLGVEKPVIANSKADVLREAMIKRVIAGTLRFRAKMRLTGGREVPEPPPLWLDTLSSIVPDTVPV